jgi:hypothetical protein
MEIDDVLMHSVISGSFDYATARKVFAADQEVTSLMAGLTKDSDRATTLRIASRVAAKGSSHVLTWLSSTLSNGRWKNDPEILATALLASERAVTLTHRGQPGALDALALVYLLRDERQKAVEAESAAISLSDGAMREAQSKNLQRYRGGH